MSWISAPIGSVFTEKNVDNENQNEFIEQIVEVAKSAIGNIKYVFGGDSISDDMTGEGDCSDFTQAVFRKVLNTDIGGTTEEQYLKGTLIENQEDLQIGDLVFFQGTYASGYIDNVSHVGIYIGDGQFIHNSSGSGGVVISDLNGNGGYYQNHWLAGKRLFEGGEFTYTTTEAQKASETDKKWWADILTLVFTILVIVLALIFFIKSFNTVKGEDKE